MNSKFAVSVSLALAAMLIFGCRQTENPILEKQKRLMQAKTLGDALNSKILLTEIREGRITNAIEILEFSIDCSIVEMEHSTNFDAVTRQEAMQTLRALKEYRLVYPRKTEAVIRENSGFNQDSKITEEANRYLTQVP